MNSTERLAYAHALVDVLYHGPGLTEASAFLVVAEMLRRTELPSDRGREVPIVLCDNPRRKP